MYSTSICLSLVVGWVYCEEVEVIIKFYTSMMGLRFGKWGKGRKERGNWFVVVVSVFGLKKYYALNLT